MRRACGHEPGTGIVTESFECCEHHSFSSQWGGDGTCRAKSERLGERKAAMLAALKSFASIHRRQNDRLAAVVGHVGGEDAFGCHGLGGVDHLG